jgi:hypothetical protein
MLAWVVINRQLTRQPRKCRSRCSLPPYTFRFSDKTSTAVVVRRSPPGREVQNCLSPYLPSSVPSSKFRIPQLLCLPLLRKLPGVYPKFPFWFTHSDLCGGDSELPFLSSRSLLTTHYPLPPIPFVFHILARSFARTKHSTCLFSSASSLFAQKHPG